MSEPYVTAWISAQRIALGRDVREMIKVGTRTVRRRKGLFSSEMMDVEEDVMEEQTRRVLTGKYSDTSIDNAKLAKDIARAANEHAKAGYELLQIIDYIGGNYALQGNVWGVVPPQLPWASAYGYSLTEGVIMVFRKSKHEPKAET